MNEEQKNTLEEESGETAQNTQNTQNTETTGDVNETSKTDNAEHSEESSDMTEKEPLDVALEEIEKLKEQLLYKAAEFDNYRKRTIKEKAELLLNGAEKTVVAVLPVVDDMERAIAEGKKTDDPEVLREGMELIFHKFQKTLEGLGVKAIETQDKDFDVDLHEAIAMVPGMGDDKKGKVIDCVLTGYTLNDKVIRHAKVAVGQ